MTEGEDAVVRCVHVVVYSFISIIIFPANADVSNVVVQYHGGPGEVCFVTQNIVKVRGSERSEDPDVILKNFKAGFYASVCKIGAVVISGVKSCDHFLHLDGRNNHFPLTNIQSKHVSDYSEACAGESGPGWGGEAFVKYGIEEEGLAKGTVDGGGLDIRGLE